MVKRLFAVLLLAACGPEFYARNYTSFIDPAYRTPPVAARSVLVLAPRAGLARRQAAETAMAEVLRSSGLVAVRGIDVFPPTRGVPTTEDVLAELRGRGLDGAVILWATSEKIEISRGTRTVTDTQYQDVYINGRTERIRVEVRREEPYVDETPTAMYSAVFVIGAGPTVWTAEATFRGPSFDAIATDAGTGAIAKLQADGMVAKPAGQAPPQGLGLILPGLK